MHYKVLCPIEKKGGGTFWVRTGTGFDNKDGSINVFLNVLPTNGKLHIRELDEKDRRPNDNTASQANEELPF